MAPPAPHSCPRASLEPVHGLPAPHSVPARASSRSMARPRRTPRPRASLEPAHGSARARSPRGDPPSALRPLASCRAHFAAFFSSRAGFHVTAALPPLLQRSRPRRSRAAYTRNFPIFSIVWLKCASPSRFRFDEAPTLTMFRVPRDGRGAAKPAETSAEPATYGAEDRLWKTGARFRNRLG